MSRKTENPDDPSSFAFIMKQIVGADRNQGKVAGDLNTSGGYLSGMLLGRYLPSQSYVKDWLDVLEEKYDLDKICEETGFTLRQMYQVKVASFVRTRSSADERNAINEELHESLWLMSGKRKGYAQYFSEIIGMRHEILNAIFTNPEIYNHGPGKKFIDKLLEVLPDRQNEIQRLRVLLLVDEEKVSAHSIKKEVRQIQVDYKQAAGILIRELREKFEDGIEDVESRFKTPVLKGKQARIESGDDKLAGSIYRDDIREVCAIYKARDPKIAAPYIVQLERIGDHLRR